MDNRPAPQSTYLNYRNGGLPVTTTRTTTTTNGNPPHTTVSPSRRPPPPPPPPAMQSLSNTLIIYISDAPSPDIHIYLSTIFSLYSISEVIIIATNDESLKLSRMDVYTAAGKMRQDIVVTTSKINGSLTAAELAKATDGLEQKTLCGVLCCQHSPSSSSSSASQSTEQTTTPLDILDYDEEQLEFSWRAGLLTLHTLARATIPLLRKAPLTPSPFFCLDSSIQLSQVDVAGQETLLGQLSASPASQGLRFGSAREELIPAPAPAPSASASQSSLALDIPPRSNQGTGAVNGMYFPGGAGGGFPNTSPLPSPGLGESPTKLWASWAMMNE